MKHSLFPSTEENLKNYPKFAQKPPRIIPSLLSKPPELSQVCFQDTQKRGGKGTCVLAFCTVAGLRLELVLSAHPFKQLGEGCGLVLLATGKKLLHSSQPFLLKNWLAPSHFLLATLPQPNIICRGWAEVNVLTEISLIFLSQTYTFNASSSLKKNWNKFMYWIHGQKIACTFMREPLQRLIFIWNNYERAIAKISFYMK